MKTMNKTNGTSRIKTVVLTTQLNLSNHGTVRRALDVSCLNHLVSLKPKGYKIVVHAVGSSDEDQGLCAELGIKFIHHSNDNLGEKKNAGLKDACKLGDIVIPFGSDDLISLGLIDKVVETLASGTFGVVNCRGMYQFHVPTKRLAYYPGPEFVLAFNSALVSGPLHETNLGAAQVDLTMRSKLWHMARRHGFLDTTINLPEGTAFVFCRSGDEIHSFDDHLQAHTGLWQMIEGPDQTEFFESLFPTIIQKSKGVKNG